MDSFNSLHALGVDRHPVAAAFIVVIQPSIIAYYTLEHCANNPNALILSVSRAAWAVVNILAIRKPSKTTLWYFLMTTCCKSAYMYITHYTGGEREV